MFKKILTALAPVLMLAVLAHCVELPCPVNGLRITIEGEEVVLRWNPVINPSGETIYRVEKASPEEKRYFFTPIATFREPYSGESAVYTVMAVEPATGSPVDEVILEDFESGTITLYSYPGEDEEPNSWNLDQTVTYQNSNYSLRVYGNTWKIQDVTPRQVSYNTVWGIAVNTYGSGEYPGEIEAFGVGDSLNELFYTFRGTELADSLHWRTTYHWVGDENTWVFHHLPLGRDWLMAYGYAPTITRFIYLNDEDDWRSNGGIYFDYICDISEDMPIAPELTVGFEVVNSPISPGMTIQFTAEAIDPDPDTLLFHWDFGDGFESDLQNPVHTFGRQGNYSVQATVHDSTMMFDRRNIELCLPAGTPYAEITVNFTGDVMMARRYVSGGLIPNRGVNVIWEPTIPILGGGADLSVVNLECPFTTNTSRPHPTKEFIFHGEPQYLDALIFAGVDGVTLANNHTTDYMEPGFLDTRQALEVRNIKHFGAGMNEYEAMQPAVFFRQGVSIGMLGYCNRTGRIDNLPPFLEAGPNKAGFTWFNQYYLERTIPQAALLYDIVVAQVHCGTEYSIIPDTTTGGDAAYLDVTPFPPPIDSTTLEYQRMALDLGADMVVAHHPHVLQGYSVYDGKLIAHSLGNFVFDQFYLETFPSMIIYAEMNRNGIFKAYFKPVFIDDYIPQPARGELAKNIIDRIADYSQRLNTVVIPDYERNRGLIALGDHQIVSRVEARCAHILLWERMNEMPVSFPLEISGKGYLTSVDSVTGSNSQYEAQFGREMLWVGNFEDEGATLWHLNSDNEIIDNLIKYEGSGALRLLSYALQGNPTSVNLENRMRWNWGEPYTMCGRVKGINAGGARAAVVSYQGRTGGDPVYIQELFPPISGTFDWRYFCEDLVMVRPGYYGDFEFSNPPPLDDQGYVWFDEVKVIRWEDGWHPLPAEIPAPNNVHFIRLRSENPAGNPVKVHFSETIYNKF